MSIHVMNRVWRESPAKGSELLLLLAIADFADDDGVAWPGVETLAKKARLSKRQTQYNIRSLVEAGMLTVEENAGPHGTHRYRVVFVAQTGDAESAPVQNVHRAKSARGGAKNVTKGVQPIAPEPSIEPSIEPSSTPQRRKPKRIQYPEAFERFWSAYPSGHGVKKLAYDEWKKIAPDDEMVEEIMTGLEAWKRCQRWRDGFIKDAERFMKHHMWESAPPVDSVRVVEETRAAENVVNLDYFGTDGLKRRREEYQRQHGGGAS